MKSQRFILVAAMVVLCIWTPGCSAMDTIKGKLGGGGKDIVTTALSKGDFTTFCDAAQKAGVEDTLRGPGPLTVFMPTDAAFQMLPQEKLDELMNPANQETLAALLKHHVVQGKYSDKDLKKITTLRALDGKMLAFTVNGQQLMVGDAIVTTKNIKCKNGIIHVIDIVLMP